MLRDLCWILLLPASVLLPCAAAIAQETAPAEFQKVEMRVVSSRPGSATLDRGRDDGLRVGDRVTLRLKDGSVSYGTLNRVQDRGANVELDDLGLAPLAGTRAEVMVPSSRFALAPAPPTEPVQSPEPAPQTAPEHAPWPKRDDAWSQGQPLLARVRPLRPSERPSDVRGRIYTIADYTRSTEDNRTDGFYRVGSEVTIENKAGQGERIHFEGELNYRNTNVPDNDDESATHLRVDRASYAVGGNRFESRRLEFGRFQQDNLPEFGVIDGAEWDRRLDGGDRVGLSAGFMPEPNADQKSTQDFQLSASYRWIYDQSEQLSAAAGFQKTLHNSNADRDLFLTQLLYLPQHGWTFSSTTWIDYYTAGDVNKGQGVEVTQAYVNTGRRWDDGSSVHVVYSHMAFPEMDRNEFLPVTAQQLADDHNDRVSLQSRVSLSEPVRVHGLIGAWVDQDDSGGDGEGGVELDGTLWKRVLIDVSVFGTEGKFVNVLGARATIARTLNDGRLSLELELANDRFDGFSSSNNDLPAQRLRLMLERYLPNGWSVAAHLDGMLWDKENSINLGFYLQKSF